MTETKFVYVIEIAEYVKRTTTAIQTQAKRLGIEPVLRRRPVSGKAALAVTADEAKRIIESNVPAGDMISPADLMKG